jgi:phage gp36-like protein
MSFLQVSDFEEIIKGGYLAEITEDYAAAITQTSATAIEEVASYLSSRYDVEQIFNKTGNDRNKLIVLFCMDIALYHLHARIDPIQIPDIRRERYKNAIETLKMIAAGQINPLGLPTLTQDDGTFMGSAFGSDRSFITKY